MLQSAYKMTKIVKAKGKDFEKFYKFFEKTLKEKYFLYPKESAAYIINAGLPKKPQLKKEILKGDMPLYVTYEKTKLIGYFLTEKVYAGVAFGYWLAVDKDFRKRGVASGLLKRWERDVAKEGAHSLHLWTTENDIGFYEKRGFILGGKFENAWFGIDHYLFYKTIGKPNPKKYV